MPPPSGQSGRSTPARSAITLLVSANGQTVLNVGSLGEVFEIDPFGEKKPREVAKLTPGPAPVAALSPDGKVLAITRLGQPSVIVCEVASGKVLHNIPRAEQGVIQALAFSPDGKTLALGSTFPGTTFWDVDTGKRVTSRGNPAVTGGHPVLFSPDGNFIVGLAGRGLLVWGYASGQVLREFDVGRGTSQVLALSPDGRVAAVADNQALRLWDLVAERELFPPPDHSGEISAARFTADGLHVTTIGTDFRACQWDAATGRRTVQVSVPAMSARALILAPDGRTVVSHDGRGIHALRLGEPGDSRLVREGVNGFSDLHAVSADGKWLHCSGYGPGGLRDALIDFETGKEARQVPLGPNGYAQLCRAISPDGRTLVVANYGQPAVRFWDTRTGSPVPLPKYADGTGFPIRSVPIVLTYSPDGKTLVVGVQEPSLWEVATGRPRFKIDLTPDGAGAVPTQCAFSADGSMLALGTPVGNIHVVATATGAVLGRLTGGHRGRITALDFAPDGARLLSGGADTTAVIWDVKAWRDKARPAAATVTPEALPDLWKELADADAARGYRAVLALAGAPKLAVPFIDEHLPREGPTPEHIDKLIRNLDADDFDVREKAMADLEALGPIALPALRRALRTTTSPEVRKRANKLVKKQNGDLVDRNEVRVIRAIEVLERAGTPEAVARARPAGQGARNPAPDRRGKGGGGPVGTTAVARNPSPTPPLSEEGLRTNAVLFPPRFGEGSGVGFRNGH